MPGMLGLEADFDEGRSAMTVGLNATGSASVLTFESNTATASVTPIFVRPTQFISPQSQVRIANVRRGIAACREEFN
jgi:hypothetical protein